MSPPKKANYFEMIEVSANQIRWQRFVRPLDPNLLERLSVTSTVTATATATATEISIAITSTPIGLFASLIDRNRTPVEHGSIHLSYCVLRIVIVRKRYKTEPA